MAVISDLEESPPSPPPATAADEASLAAVLARIGPLPFLAAAIDLVRRRSDFFLEDGAVGKVQALLSAAKASAVSDAGAAAAAKARAADVEKSEAAAKARATDAAKSEAAGKARAADAAKSETAAKARAVAEAEGAAKARADAVSEGAGKGRAGTEAVDLKPREEKLEEPKVEANGKRAPNSGNGMDLEKYSWTQTLQEVSVSIPIPEGTKSRFLICEIKANHLKAGLKGQPPIIDGDLCASVKADDSFWSIEDGKSLSVLLTKQDQMNWWACLIKGDPEIDTQKVEPEASKLSDLDGETRQTVEKMLFDQRQKQMGLPTSKEIEQQEMLKKFMSQHPEMDFSKTKFQ